MAVEKTGCEAFTLCIAHILRDKDKHYFQFQIISAHLFNKTDRNRIFGMQNSDRGKGFSKKISRGERKTQKNRYICTIGNKSEAEMTAMNTYDSTYRGTLRGMMTMGMMCMRSRFRRV
ncbi:hypothetical protein [Alistipes finegoldii]|uniref:hypothetical protein n=1 Tax=Alistipes finegoldii TaxID=214856 RepID=UPI003FD7559F